MDMKTKYVILVGDGMADRPEDFPGGLTPLAAALTVNMDRVASEGEAGLVRTVPPGMDPGSDVANMALLGFDPMRYYSGRAPIEAASMGVELAPGQVAYRCNLVHIEPSPSGLLAPDSVMGSYSAGHITTAEARPIIESLEGAIGRPGRRLYPGVSYRHLLVQDGAPRGTRLTPPHDISGRPIGDYLPAGEGAEALREIMSLAAPVLALHPVNARRAAAGKPTANAVWFWGHGTRPSFPSLREKYGLTGAVISAVDLVKGLGRLLGMEVVNVPGATGYLDTDYEGKARAALEALDRADLVFVHVEAPDEAGHQGDLSAKLQAIADFDRRVVGPVLAGIRHHPSWAVMVVTDHPTPVSIKTHSAGAVPWAILRSEKPPAAAVDLAFNETSLAGQTTLEGGEALMRRFIGAS